MLRVPKVRAQWFKVSNPLVWAACFSFLGCCLAYVHDFSGDGHLPCRFDQSRLRSAQRSLTIFAFVLLCKPFYLRTLLCTALQLDMDTLTRRTEGKHLVVLRGLSLTRGGGEAGSGCPSSRPKNVYSKRSFI
ncbi:hypothetical protein DFH29DRAFT_47463 [Suillus ampliporus]|nr:hypothetical protein DFH29DRAFT_47463 [Suillus ampliporus]